MGTQLELFEKKEIPKELKELLCGNGENDFMVGIETAKGLGLNVVECLQIALLNFEIDIPDCSEYEHFSVKYGEISFSLVEFEYEDINFWLIIKTTNGENHTSVESWGGDDDFLTMQKKLKSKLKGIVKDNYHYFKELLQ